MYNIPSNFLLLLIVMDHPPRTDYFFFWWFCFGHWCLRVWLQHRLSKSYTFSFVRTRSLFSYVPPLIFIFRVTSTLTTFSLFCTLDSQLSPLIWNKLWMILPIHLIQEISPLSIVLLPNTSVLFSCTTSLTNTICIMGLKSQNNFKFLPLI